MSSGSVRVGSRCMGSCRSGPRKAPAPCREGMEPQNTQRTQMAAPRAPAPFAPLAWFAVPLHVAWGPARGFEAERPPKHRPSSAWPGVTRPSVGDRSHVAWGSTAQRPSHSVRSLFTSLIVIPGAVEMFMVVLWRSDAMLYFTYQATKCRLVAAIQSGERLGTFGSVWRGILPTVQHARPNDRSISSHGAG